MKNIDVVKGMESKKLSAWVVSSHCGECVYANDHCALNEEMTCAAGLAKWLEMEVETDGAADIS